MTLSKLHKLYFNMHNTYAQKYGKSSTIILMQVGKFYEIYSTVNYVEGPDLLHISKN